MIIFLVRHGEEICGFRGGWSSTELAFEGIRQAEGLAEYFFNMQNEYNIKKIYSSDLKRAVQTAEKVSEKLDIPVVFKRNFREVNNGDLAGLDNEKADIIYPNLYWKKLGWNENYPNGESPADFFERVSTAWNDFLKTVKKENENVILVTHGGVIQIILSILKHEKYSNNNSYGNISCCDIIKIEADCE